MRATVVLPTGSESDTSRTFVRFNDFLGRAITTPPSLVAGQATRAGLPISDATQLVEQWQIPVARFAELLDLSDRHWRRINRTDKSLGMIESDCLSRVQKILQHVSDVFGTAEAAEHWV